MIVEWVKAGLREVVAWLFSEEGLESLSKPHRKRLQRNNPTRLELRSFCFSQSTGALLPKLIVSATRYFPLA